MLIESMKSLFGDPPSYDAFTPEDGVCKDEFDFMQMRAHSGSHLLKQIEGAVPINKETETQLKDQNYLPVLKSLLRTAKAKRREWLEKNAERHTPLIFEEAIAALTEVLPPKRSEIDEEQKEKIQERLMDRVLPLLLYGECRLLVESAFVINETLQNQVVKIAEAYLKLVRILISQRVANYSLQNITVGAFQNQTLGQRMMNSLHSMISAYTSAPHRSKWIARIIEKRENVVLICTGLELQKFILHQYLTFSERAFSSTT